LLPQLLIKSVPLHEQGEPALLGASVRNALGQESIMITGLAAGSTLSAGRAVGNSWRVEPAELNSLLVHPPRGFVGAMDVSIELRFADVAIDRKSVRLEWTRKLAPPTERQ
jgi:hypothetical protein